MRWKLTVGVLMALAFLIPAAPASAGTEPPGLDKNCQTVERKVYQDVRELITIDLDTATEGDVRVLAYRILDVADTDSLPTLSGVMQEQLRGTADDLRAFLKASVQRAWSTALRISVVQTLTGAGTNVRAAAQKTLDAGNIDGYLAYLNDGLHAARALDCAAQPTSTPSVTPSATTTASPTASSSASATPTASASPTPTSPAGPGTSGGEGGGLPVTGADTAAVAGVGGALVLLGGACYLIGRRRRSRFVA